VLEVAKDKLRGVKVEQAWKTCKGSRRRCCSMRESQVHRMLGRVVMPLTRLREKDHFRQGSGWMWRVMTTEPDWHDSRSEIATKITSRRGR
jgi:hypothetical protein